MALLGWIHQRVLLALGRNLDELIVKGSSDLESTTIP